MYPACRTNLFDISPSALLAMFGNSGKPRRRPCWIVMLLSVVLQVALAQAESRCVFLGSHTLPLFSGGWSLLVASTPAAVTEDAVLPRDELQRWLQSASGDLSCTLIKISIKLSPLENHPETIQDPEANSAIRIQ
ncbi:hypothetical protein E1301_Tti016297 [Triplophysa tibetana]|uniref:Uncharacterized protein n=1 Tax=Triplophysa tibetana TaxID=1572043 RepID=A0A5A9PTI2_9TELE|nr:hypothetical protein E1301_Tti016297 [Triplophysa tibetana]